MTATIAYPKAQVLSCLPREDYDTLPGWNASLLKLAISKTPRHAWSAYRDPERPAQKGSPAFRIGTMLHQALLEPEEWALIEPCEHGATTKAYATAAAQLTELGRTIAQASEYEVAKTLSTSIHDHSVLGQFFDPKHRGLNELTLAWVDMKSGHPCKARLDAVRFTGNELIILDLKSTADASPIDFGKSAANYGYVLQGSFYTDSVFNCLGELEKLLELAPGALRNVPVSFEFVCAEKEYPFQVARYRLTAEQLLIGRRMYQKALDLVTVADEMDFWPGYPVAPMPLELPPWAWGQMERLIGEEAA
jgi:hypothetical protein